MKALLLAALLSQAPDAGTDTPALEVVTLQAGTVLTEPMACESPAQAQAFDVALRSAQGDAAGFKAEILSGSGATAQWAVIAAAVGFVVGGVVTGVAVAALKK